MTAEEIIVQLCCELNQAHNEILKLEGIPWDSVQDYDWMDESTPAIAIRDAEQFLGRKLVKTNRWTYFPVQNTTT